MKYLGIDYGTKRVGVAVSDETATLARPFSTLKNDALLIAELSAIVAKENIGGIVVGLSTGNKVEEAITDFIARLTLETMLPIERVTEAFTSYEAHGRQGKESKTARAAKTPAKPADLDAGAAAIILARFLEKKKSE